MLSEPAILASLAAAWAATLGLAAVAIARSWAERNEALFAAFASGLLVTTAVTHLIPEYVNAAPNGSFYVLGGFLALYALGALAAGGDGVSPRTGLTAAILPALAIGFHSFIDGIVYTVAFANSMFTGALAAAGLIVHEFSEGVILLTLLLRTGVRRMTAYALAFIGAALTTPAGAILSTLAFEGLDPHSLASPHLIAAGALLYVGATHLANHGGPRPPRATLAAFFGGALVAAAFVMLSQH